MTLPPSPCGTLRRCRAPARLLLEDRADQLLLRGQLGLALRRHLADQEVARPDLGADADDAAVVEVLQGLLGAVGDVARDLLVAQLRRAGVDLVLVDVDRREHVVLHEPLGDDDGVLEVVALERHERDEQVLAQSELALEVELPSASVARLHLVAETDDRLLVDERALVRAHELHELVLVLAVLRLDGDRVGVESTTVPAFCVMTTSPVSTAARYSRPVPISGGSVIMSGTACRCMFAPMSARFASLCSRNGSARSPRRRSAPGSRPCRRPSSDRPARARRPRPEHRGVDELAGLLVDRLVRLRDDELLLLARVEIDDLVGDLAALDDAVGRRDEAELDTVAIEASEPMRPMFGPPASRSGTCARSGSVHVAHLDRRALAREAARAERGQAPAVRRPASEFVWSMNCESCGTRRTPSAQPRPAGC